MKAIQQIAGRIETLQAGLAGNERVDVFDGAAALGRNLGGGTLPATVTEIPMTPTVWQLYNPPGEIEPGGGILIRVPGVYLLGSVVRYPVGAGTATVTVGISFGLPVYTFVGTSAVAATTADFWQSAHLVRYLASGDIVRLCAQTTAPIAWQWAVFRVALLGMVE